MQKFPVIFPVIITCKTKLRFIIWYQVIIIMTIEQIDKSKVMILLGTSDMRDFSLEYDTLSFSDPHSRRILSRLLKLACNKTGMDTIGKKMLVEALPHESGCLILLTLTPKRERTVYKVKRSDKTLCCYFDDVEALIRAAQALGSDYYLPENSVYLYEGKYCLLVKSRPVSVFVLAMLEEFSDTYMLDKISAARIRENGKLICGKNAVLTLAGSFR